MSLVKILTDSTCDLSQEIINSRNIHVIPLKVCFKEEVYLDRIDITYDEMIDGNKVLNARIFYDGICCDCLKLDKGEWILWN